MNHRSSLDHPMIDLAKRQDVYDFIFAFFEQYVEGVGKIMKGRSVNEFGKELTEFEHYSYCYLVTIFHLKHDTDGVKIAPGWSGAPLGAHLRRVFATDMLSLSVEQLEALQEDEAVIDYGLGRLLTEMNGMIADFMRNRDTYQVEDESRRLHELCLRWSSILTNDNSPLGLA